MKKILAIDDQKDNLITIKGFLKNFLPDCTLFLAESGKEGIAIAQKEQPDTILLDIIMPEMDGFEVCEILKQDERTKYIPIIMLSALGQDTDSRVKGLNLGADAFLAKPFIPIELQAQINVMLRIKEAEDKMRTEKDVLEETVQERTYKLIESERRISTLINNLQGIAYRCKNDKDWTMEFISKGIIDITGYTPEDIIDNKTLSFNDLIIPEDQDRVWKEIQSAIEKKESFEIDYQIKTKSGEIRYLLEKGNGVFASDTGEFLALEGFVNDVTKSKLADEALRNSEERYKSLVTNLPIGIFRSTYHGKVLSVNPAMAEIYGYDSEEELLDVPAQQYYTSDNQRYNMLTELEKNESLLGYETMENKKDGSKIWVSTNYKITKNDKLELSYIDGAVIDITERKHAEEDLKKSKNFFEQLFQQSATSRQLFDPDGLTVKVNPTFCKLFGVERKDIEGKYNIFHDKEAAITGLVDKIKLVIEQKKSIEVEIFFDIKLAADSSGVTTSKPMKIWFHVTIYPILDIDGELINIMFEHIDITERKHAEDALQASEELNRSITQSAADAIISINQDGDILSWNNAAERIFGYSSTEMINKDLLLIIPNKFQDGHNTGIKRLKKGGKEKLVGGTIEITAVRKGGLEFPIELSLSSWESDNQKYFTGIIRDITERKKAEEEQIRSEIRFKRLFDGLGDAVFVTRVGGEDKGRILEVNSAAITQTGYSREELLKMNIIKELSVAGSGELSADDWEEKLLKGEVVTTVEKKKRKDGTEFWTEMIVTQIDFKGEKASLSINHDITNRKRAEQIQKILYNIANAVIASYNLENFISLIQKELSTIIDTSNFYIALYDHTTDHISLPFFADEKDEFISFPAEKTLTYYVIETKKSLFVTKKEIKKLEKSGKFIHRGTYAEIWLGVPLKTGGKVTGVLAVQSYTDENAFNESDVKMLEFVSAQISISIERKKKEQELISTLKKATESDRLKSAFLATMSHELRTPLNAIIGFSDLISPDWPIEEVYDFARTINSSGSHLLSIVEDLFDITLIESGETKIEKKKVDILLLLNDINKIMLTEQQKLDKVNIEMSLVIPKESENLILNTDSVKLKQILINLIKNALKFTHGGQINYGFSIEDIKGSSYFKFYVSDTGIGISKDKQEFIFDLFRQIDDSHTRTYEGTGIGLSISKKLTELLGGSIWLESEENVGSTFYFTIPYEMTETNDKSDVAGTNEDEAIEPKRKLSSDGKTLLIVEDDEASYELLKILIGNPLVNIMWAKNGKMAIHYCKNNQNIDLVLMDINMPVMNGHEATKEIKKFRPKLPIIAQTAYAIAGDKEKALDAGCDDYISKPIKKELLRKKIEKWL